MSAHEDNSSLAAPQAAGDTTSGPAVGSGSAGANPSTADPDASPRVNWGEKLLEHKLAVMVALGLFLALGLAAWYYSLSKQAAAEAPPSAASTGQIDGLAQAATPPETTDPQAALDHKLADEENPVRVEEATPDALLANPHQDEAPATDEEPRPSPAEQAAYRRQAAAVARANNTDSAIVTRRDPQTGQFTPQRVAQRRVNFSRAPAYAGTGPGPAAFGAAGANADPALLRPRPQRDVDGTPFETNDEINLMLTNLPAGVKAQYEKMSGRRFRPLLASQQQQAKERRSDMMYIPGMDGFNTVKFRGSNADPAEDLESALVPDVFYRCTVQGTQVVRTGSVVMLRLAEDATFGGITFPRNMVFAAVASVESNRVTLGVDRLGPHRVGVQVYNYAYLPGIMIDPGKRVRADGGQSMGSTLQQSSTSELSNAIAQSQQAANSWQGIGGRMAVTLLGRMPKVGQRLRDVTLPDGYPVLVTRASDKRPPAAAGAGYGTPGGIMGQDGNPLQSPFMQGVGIGGYPAQPGYQNLPPSYVLPAVPQAGAAGRY